MTPLDEFRILPGLLLMGFAGLFGLVMIGVFALAITVGPLIAIGWIGLESVKIWVGK